jgi:hypothetical protein
MNCFIACLLYSGLRPHLEQIGLQTPDTDVEPIQPAAEVDLLGSALALLHAGGRDEQLGADELDARDVLRGQADPAEQLSAWGDLEDHGLAVDGVPHVALGVDAVAVRLAGPVVRVEDALVGDGAVRRRVVEGVHGARRRVREVHGLLVPRPADRVGDRDGALHFLPGLLAVEEVQSS